MTIAYTDLRPWLLALLSNAVDGTRSVDLEAGARMLGVLGAMRSEEKDAILAVLCAWVVGYMEAINGRDDIDQNIADLVDGFVACQP